MALLITSSARTEQWIFTGGRFSSVTMSLFLIASASAMLLPLIHSVAREDEAIAEADAVLLSPSNPVVSIGTILGVPGIREALAAKTVVGVSPIIDGSPVRGMADACLDAIGVETSTQAVGRHYGARSSGGLLDGWLVDSSDAGATVPGVEVRAVPLLMSDLQATAAMARSALELAGA